jgi:hypothetical protein
LPFAKLSKTKAASNSEAAKSTNISRLFAANQLRIRPINSFINISVHLRQSAANRLSPFRSPDHLIARSPDLGGDPAAALEHLERKSSTNESGWYVVRNQASFLIVVCLCIAVLAGCGSVSGSINSMPTPTPTPGVSPSPSPAPSPSPTPAAASRFIYGISVFESDTGYEGGTINSTSGQVTPIAPFNNAALGQNIVPQLIADPTGHFLYALNLGASSFGNTIGHPGIEELAINQQTGALTVIPGSPLVFPSQRPGMLAINPAGTLLFQPDAGVFDVYLITPGTGLLTHRPSSTAASLGAFSAFSPDGRFLFNAGDGDVETLSVDSSGNLTVVQPPIPTGGSAPALVGQLAVSPDGKLLYVLNQGSIGIFNVSAGGTLAPVVGSPFATQAGEAGFALTPDGKHKYPSGLHLRSRRQHAYAYRQRRGQQCHVHHRGWLRQVRLHLAGLRADHVCH